ncbi:MAG: (2Fe-2S)-binding protein [Rhizobiales bacterium]|nr:(2Fe-2S)-binding protein [Hyphomicrobiales bacterium]
MSGWRLKSGGTIDRDRRVRFQWDGRSYEGFAGDTLASALLANGISLVGRSFKYHRPRGLFAAGLEEPNGIVQLEADEATIPNLKATQIELYDGLIATPVNVKPSLEFDLMAANSLVKRFIPAAFYYKTFMWPGWHWFEPSIRRAAGLGTAPAEPDPDAYEHRFAHTDILVVGAGAAGIAAALAAAESGTSVMLVEVEPELGGGLRDEKQPVEGQSATAWLKKATKALASKSNVTILRRTMAFGFYDHGLIGLHERIADHLPPDQRHGPRQRLWKVRCGQVILATGAFERPFPFARNDLPGVMLASSALSYLSRYAVAPGRNIVIATNNDSAYTVGLALHDAGIQISAIIDSRTTVGACARDAEEKAIRLILGAAPVRAKGRLRIESVSFAPVSSTTETGSVGCDTLLVSGGWNPTVHLHSQSGACAASAQRPSRPDASVYGRPSGCRRSLGRFAE